MTRPELDAIAPRFAKKLSSELPRGYGFSLVLFNYEPGGWLSYISSANRADMIRTMEELLARWKAQAETGSAPDCGAQA